MTIKEEIYSHVELDYRDFSSKLTPGAKMVGVRIPTLRKIAKKAVKTGDLSFLEEADTDIFEEKLVCGFIIAYMSIPFKEKKELVAEYVNKIDNWSVCDCFCSSFRFGTAERKDVFDFSSYYAAMDSEFGSRFGVIMMMCHLLDDEYIDMVLPYFAGVKCTAYYARMGAAWALATALAKFQDKALPYIIDEMLDGEIFRLTVRKCVESYRIPLQTKDMLKKLNNDRKVIRKEK